MVCTDLNGRWLGAFHTPAEPGGSVAGEEALAQRTADSAKLNHEKRIIKNFRNMIVISFLLRMSFFLLENMCFNIETCRERDTEF